MLIHKTPTYQFPMKHHFTNPNRVSSIPLPWAEQLSKSLTQHSSNPSYSNFHGPHTRPLYLPYTAVSTLLLSSHSSQSPKSLNSPVPFLPSLLPYFAYRILHHYESSIRESSATFISSSRWHLSVAAILPPGDMSEGPCNITRRRNPRPSRPSSLHPP